MIVRIAASLLCAIATSSAALAGNVTITVSADPTYSAALPEAVVGPTTLLPQHVGGDQWSITSDQSQFITTVSVSASADGYVGSRDAFDLPYSMVNSGATELGAALTKADASDVAVITFLGTASARAKTADLILFNLQTRSLWEARERLIAGGEVRFQSIDANLAYWDIQSSSQLVSKTFMQIDSSTDSAIAWMSAALHNSNLNGLFGPAGVSRKDANAALTALNDRIGTLYDTVILSLKKDIQSGRPDKLAAACLRTSKLNDFFYGIPDQRIRDYDGPHANVLVASTLQAICTTRKIKRDLGSGVKITQDEQDDAHAAIATIDAQVARAKSISMWPDAQKEALARSHDLDEVLTSIGHV